MSDANAQPPGAGWYPDPAGSGTTRWWDGARWTDHFGATLAPGAPAATPFAATVPASRHTYAAPYRLAPATYKAPDGTSPHTPYIWVLALLPLVDTAVSALRGPPGDEDFVTDPTVPVLALADIAQYGVGLLLFGAAMLLIVLDQRALAQAGVPRPFHWAWGFFMFVGAPVYMIGRSIIVRRRVGSGLAPMILNLALIALNVAIGIVFVVISTSTVLENSDFS